MKITYINHSSFSVELENCVLLFDYFKGNIPKFDKHKKIYVFASHQHYDHYDLSIFELESEYNNITYILSDDITYILSDDITNAKSNNVKFVKENQNIRVDNLEIKTLESTDLGVAFIIKVEGKTIYHAGDLNWWHWENEQSDEKNEEAGNRYKNIINKIKDTNFDVAFIPLDSRQGEQYYLGFDNFMKSTNTKYAFPMHFWRTYSIIKLLKTSEHAKSYKDNIMEISKENQTFELI